MPFEASEIPRELADAVRTGDCVAFVGAGLSAAAGLPDWKTFLRQMVDWCREQGADLAGKLRDIQKEIREGKLIDVAQTLRDEMGDQRFYEFMNKRFRDPSLKPTENHSLVAELGFACVLTSNFDKLIEEAWAAARRSMPRVYTQQDTCVLANLQRDKSFYVLKLHGDVDRTDTIVLGRKDYREIQFGNDAFKFYFSALWQTKTVLFMGFSLDDPDIALRLEELTEAFKGYGGRHYALMSTEAASAVRRKRLDEDYHIRVIPYRKSPGHPEVTEFLKALKAHAGAAPVPREVTTEEQGREAKALEDYRKRLIADHEYLDFRGILQVREFLRLRLENLYVPLNATVGVLQRTSAPALPEGDRSLKALKEHPSRRGRREPTRQQLMLFPAAVTEQFLERRVTVAEVLREHRRLIVLGDPGSGKSALLKLLAIKFSRGRDAVREAFGLDEELLPLLLPIAAYGDAVADRGVLAFCDFVMQRGAADRVDGELTRRKLEAGECILLLDGLDEVLDLNTRIRVSRQIERFIRNCAPGNRVVITSRIAGYQRVGLGGDVAHLTLAPFGDEDIRAFACNWAYAYEGSPRPTEGWEQRAEDRARNLTEAMLAPAIQRLATKPLLATILALIHHQGTRLPHQRVELYRLCVEALAEHWHRARQTLYPLVDLHLGARRLDEPFVVSVLAPIAFSWVEARPTGLLHRDELEERIARHFVEQESAKGGQARLLARQFVELIREQSGLLDERGADYFDFLHPTFKEYLAARHLAERRRPLKLLGKRLFQPRWREVVLLTAGILKGEHLADYLQGILNSRPEYGNLFPRPLFLAARCLADDVPASPALRQRVIEELIRFWARPPFEPMAEVVEGLFAEAKGSSFARQIAACLASIPRSRCVPKRTSLTLPVGDQLWGFPATRGLLRRWCVGKVLADLGDRENAAPLLQGLAQDVRKEAQVRAAAAQLLWEAGERDAAEAILLAWIKDPNAPLPGAGFAVRVLGHVGKTESVVATLLSLAEEPQLDGWLRVEIGTALGKLGESQKAVETLSTFAEDPSVRPDLRCAAARAFGQLGQQEKAVALLLALLKDRMGARWVRLQAVEGLGELGHCEDAVPVLWALVKDRKEEGYVRAAAASALGKLGDPAEIIPVLTALAKGRQEDWLLRSGAVQALGRLGEPERAAAMLLAWAGDRKLAAWQRGNALWALSRLAAGGNQARKTLARIARSRESVRDAAWQALWNLIGAGPAL